MSCGRQVHVDKGMRDGQKITFRGEGNQKPGIEPGDVIVVLQQAPHEVFQREGHVSTGTPTGLGSGLPRSAHSLTGQALAGGAGLKQKSGTRFAFTRQLAIMRVI